MSKLRRATAVVVVTTAAVLAWSPAAGATTYYRYWSYWHRAPGSTTWSYSNVGPNGYYPPAGSVEGWRYDVGTASAHDPSPRFSGPSSCKANQVGLVVDFGDSRIQVSCVQDTSNTTGAQVLGSTHSVRENNSGLVCAIDGDPPPPQCGDVVGGSHPRTTRPTARPTPTPSPSPSSTVTAAVRSAAPLVATTHRPHRRHHRAPTTPTASPPSSAPSPVAVTVAKPPASGGGGVPVGLVVGLPLAAVLAGAAAWKARRT